MEEKNRVFTPKEVELALLNLPGRYVPEVKEILSDWKEKGLVEKVFCQNYIVNIKNRKGNAFHKDVMQALVIVGTRNLEIKKLYGRETTKKASPSN